MVSTCVQYTLWRNSNPHLRFTTLKARRPSRPEMSPAAACAVFDSVKLPKFHMWSGSTRSCPSRYVCTAGPRMTHGSVGLVKPASHAAAILSIRLKPGYGVPGAAVPRTSTNATTLCARAHHTHVLGQQAALTVCLLPRALPTRTVTGREAPTHRPGGTYP